jgi:hypothetical protein
MSLSGCRNIVNLQAFDRSSKHRPTRERRSTCPPSVSSALTAEQSLLLSLVALLQPGGSQEVVRMRPLQGNGEALGASSRIRTYCFLVGAAGRCYPI